jgi:hypothetical protein
VIRGTIILESLRAGTTLTGFPMVVREIGRGRPKLSSEQIAAGFPTVWSGLEFEMPEERGGELALALSRGLDTIGWYANFSSEAETFVIFPGRVFRYPRGNPQQRAEAQAHGRTLGVPAHQLDWTE